MKKSIAMFLLGATLAFGLALSASIIANAAVKVTKKDMIRVKGSAVKNVRSDFGTWNGSISVTDLSTPQAYARLNQHKLIVMHYFKNAGFQESDVRWDSIEREINFRRNDKGVVTDTVLSYTLTQSFQISSPKVDLLDALSRNATTLLRQGVYLRSHTPNFIVTHLDSYKMELLQEATKNGYERAKVLAGNTGGKVGSLLSASQGIFQVLAPGGSDISDYGTYDKTTVMKEVKAVVTLEFKVQ